MIISYTWFNFRKTTVNNYRNVEYRIKIKLKNLWFGNFYTSSLLVKNTNNNSFSVSIAQNTHTHKKKKKIEFLQWKVQVIIVFSVYQ